jgi:hypothetical protein
MSGVLTRHASALGLPGVVAAVRLLEARLTHPHRPESPVCRGWATYVVTTEDAETVHLYVKGFPGEGDVVLDGAVGSDRRAIHLPDPGLVVWRFPDDPRLPALPALVDPRRLARILPPRVRDVLGPDQDLRVTVVRYQPEASATLRVESAAGSGPSVFAKHLPGDAVVDVAARHEMLWAGAGVTSGLLLAEPLGVDPERGVHWTRGVPGEPLTAAVAPARLAEAIAPLGRLLAALHTAPVQVPERLTVDDLLSEMRKKADKIARAHPPTAGLLSELVRAATARRRDVVHERDRCLHGDFHLDQLVASPEGPVLVDLDSMVRGAPEIDLAEFLVDLALRDRPDPVAHDVARGLLASYAAAAGTATDAALLAVCADAEFVNRCYRHLRRHGPGWEAALEAELDRRGVVHSLLGA